MKKAGVVIRTCILLGGVAGTLELSDLASDHREQRNLAAEQPAIAARMTARLNTARTDNPEYPTSGARKEPRKE